MRYSIHYARDEVDTYNTYTILTECRALSVNSFFIIRNLEHSRGSWLQVHFFDYSNLILE